MEKNKIYMKREMDEDIRCGTAIRKLYYKVAPMMASFSLKIVDVDSDEVSDDVHDDVGVLEKIEFQKRYDGDDEQLKLKERYLDGLLEKLNDRDPYATITCEIRSGFGISYWVKVRTSEDSWR